MSDLTPEAKKFLERHASTGTPSSKQKARARAAVLAGLASSSAAAAVAGGVGVGTKLVVAVMVAAVGGAVAVPAVKWARTPKHATVVAMAEAPQLPVVAPLAPVPQAVEVVPAPAPPVRKIPLRRPAVHTEVEPEPAPVVAMPAPSPPSDAQLAAEVELLTAAQASLRASRPEEALHTLDEHQRRFGSHARLVEEVIAARVGALCALGRSDDARAELTRLPSGSVFLSRLGHACW